MLDPPSCDCGVDCTQPLYRDGRILGLSDTIEAPINVEGGPFQAGKTVRLRFQRAPVFPPDAEPVASRTDRNFDVTFPLVVSSDGCQLQGPFSSGPVRGWLTMCWMASAELEAHCAEPPGGWRSAEVRYR